MTATSAKSATIARPDGPRRRAARFLAGHDRIRLALGLSVPLFWLLVVYIGALVALLVTSLFHLVDDPTGLLTRLDTSFSGENYQRLADTEVYRDVTLRTLEAAAIVTVI